MADFTQTELRVVGKRVFRLGLAANYGIEEAAIRGAFERGINYVFVTSRGKLAAPLRDALAKDREKIVVADSILDQFMIRYNAAHPGAERDIFPHLAKRRPQLVAYTATSWRKLLARPRGWTGNVPTAGDCYRFCLSSPHVDLVLTGPASGAQLDENLAALAKGPLSADEDAWMRDFGRTVHG